jgi:hypothetical protein
VRLRTSTLDLLAIEFAAAAADGEMEAAEGWLILAQRVAARDPRALDRERAERSRTTAVLRPSS